MENIAFKRHIRHVDFTAAIIKLKLNQQVYLEDFYGNRKIYQLKHLCPKQIS